MSLLKMNVSDYNDILGIKNIKDIKLLMKSIDFLRIFIKLKFKETKEPTLVLNTLN